MAGLFPDALRGGLQVEQRATAARAGDKLGLGDAGAGALEKVVGQLRGAHRVGLGLHAHQIAEAVAEQPAGEKTGLDQPAEKTGVRAHGGRGGVANPDRAPGDRRRRVLRQRAIGTEGVAASVDSGSLGSDAGRRKSEHVKIKRSSPSSRRASANAGKIPRRHVDGEKVAMAERTNRAQRTSSAGGAAKPPAEHQAAATGGQESGQIAGRDGRRQIEDEKIGRERRRLQNPPQVGQSPQHPPPAPSGLPAGRRATRRRPARPAALLQLANRRHAHHDARRCSGPAAHAIGQVQCRRLAAGEMKRVDGAGSDAGIRRVDGGGRMPETGKLGDASAGFPPSGSPCPAAYSASAVRFVHRLIALSAIARATGIS